MRNQRELICFTKCTESCFLCTKIMSISQKTKSLHATKDDNEVAENPMQKLEDALVLCQFGWFNIQLMAASFLSILATTAVSTSTSFILTGAECDLDMDMMQKGMLNAMPFLGQFSAALFTGFITDAFGRKMFLVGGSFGLFLAAIFGAFSQTYNMLLIAKLIEGIVMSLVYTATATMVPEFTHKFVRDRILVLNSSLMSLSIVVAALLAWAILPHSLHFVVVDNLLVINSWNIYLLFGACWSLLAALMYWYLPESPKFLLSQGNEKEALKTIKIIYRTNTGKGEDSFPIATLNVPGGYKSAENVSVRKKVTNALFEVKELFRPPLVFRLALFSVITFVCLLAYSALRLWYPQISTTIENYQRTHDGQMDRFCVMIDSQRQGNDTGHFEKANIGETVCIPHLAGSETYTNAIILGLVSFVSVLFSGYLVHFLGQKPLIFLFLVLCAICSGALYWTNSSIQIAILISATCAFMQTAFSLQYNILARVFPTTVRTIALSIVIMVGRAGSLIGNILFPIMMEMGCMVPFLTLSVISSGVAGLVYFLPNPRKENSVTGDK